VRREEPSEVDVSRGEAVEHDLDRLIERRHDQRAASEEQRRIEDGWAQNTARCNAERWRECWVGGDGHRYDAARLYEYSRQGGEGA
jgi:hypothetical protein